MKFRSAVRKNRGFQILLKIVCQRAKVPKWPKAQSESESLINNSHMSCRQIHNSRISGKRVKDEGEKGW
jgi:hypothetical protein